MEPGSGLSGISAFMIQCRSSAESHLLGKDMTSVRNSTPAEGSAREESDQGPICPADSIENLSTYDREVNAIADYCGISDRNMPSKETAESMKTQEEDTGQTFTIWRGVYSSVDPDADGLKDLSDANLTKNQQALNHFAKALYRKGFRGGLGCTTSDLFSCLNYQAATSQARGTQESPPTTSDSVTEMAADRSTVIPSDHAHRTNIDATGRRQNFRNSSEIWKENDGDDENKVSETGNIYRRQTSDTSLPDVILSATSEMAVTSPDVILSESSPFSPGSFNEIPTYIPLQSSEQDAEEQVNSPVPDAAERKLQMEGKVNDPKATGGLRRQVSFSRTVSVCGDTFNKNTCLAPNQSCLSDESDTSLSQSGQERLSSSSADEKRQRYSQRTSGYGTGESSKTSTQNGSTEDQTVVNEVFHSEDSNKPAEDFMGNSQSTIPTNTPFLSILEQNVNYNSATYSECSDHTHVEESEHLHNTAVVSDQSSTQTQTIGTLPNLSILRSQHDSSVMVSIPQNAAPRHNREGMATLIPPEVEICLTSIVNSVESSRTSASDNYALKTLEIFQRSPSSSTHSYHSQISNEKSRHSSQRSGHRGQTHKAHLQKMREELIANHIEDLLFHLNHRNADTAQFENVMYRIKHVLASESTSPSPITPLTPQIRQGTNERCSQSKADFQHRSFSFENHQVFELHPKHQETQNCLVLASRCDYYLCPYPKCKLGKDLLKRLETSLLTCPYSKTYIEYTEVLTCLFEHSQQCDEFKCPVPWCTFLSIRYNNQSYEDIDLKQVAKKLTELAQFPTMRFTSMSNNSDESFHPLNSQCPARPQVEGTDWMALTRMGKFGSSVLAMENQSLKKWVVKRIQLTHPEEDNRLAVYRMLRGHNFAHVVTYLWMKQTGKVLLVSSMFEPGGTLHDCLQAYGPFKSQHALHFFQQILAAAAFLHGLKILYLYWKAKNVVLDNRGVVKLCNFSTAVYYEGSFDIEELLWLIPATLLCPELLSGDVWLCPEVDSWGLGCLLVELVTGMSSRQDLIHLDRTETEKQIKDSPLPAIFPGNSTVQNILHKCLQIKPSQRLPAAQLRDDLLHQKKQVA